MLLVALLLTAMDRPPEYDRARWLADSLDSAELLVRGTPRLAGEAATLEVEAVLWGAGARAGERLPLALPYRFRWGSAGAWLLVRAPGGWVSLNPDPGPLPPGELPPAPARRADLQQRDLGGQVVTFYRRGSAEVWHGNSVSPWAPGVLIEVYRDGAKVAARAFDGQGRLRYALRRPASGEGYLFELEEGAPAGFRLYRDGEPEGLERAYRAGVLRRETHWRRGVRHGVERLWDERGRLQSEERYEDGLLPPVHRHRGPPRPGAKLSATEQGVSYFAPRELTGRLQVGQTVEEVSALLGLDVSARTGLVFPTWQCETALHVEFEGDRVARLLQLPNGAHCE